MSYKLTSVATASGHTFAAIPSKNGKISTQATRQADALNTLSRAALLGVALTGKGAMRKRAAEVFKADAVTLADYFNAASDGIAIDGSRYGELRALIAAELGAGHLTPVKGKAGCAEVCRVARLVAEKRFLMAETEKQQTLAGEKLDRIDAIAAMVQHHYELSDAAMLAAQAVKDAATSDDTARVNVDAE